MTTKSDGSSLEILKRRLDALQKRVWAAELRERAQHAIPLIGKCFRYRNSYSCPKDDSERWWLYRRVLRMSASGRLLVFQFQTDHCGQITIEPGSTVIDHESIGERISLRQFEHAWMVLLTKLTRTLNREGVIR
jgi:hypothetical protein